MNRLIRETGNGADIRYSYDKFGNRTLMNVSGAETYTTSYTYDKNNRLLQESKQAQTGTESTRYYYDPNGNQTCQQILAFGNAADGQLSSELLPAGSEQASGVSVYEYDLFNQLTRLPFYLPILICLCFLHKFLFVSAKCDYIAEPSENLYKEESF